MGKKKDKRARREAERQRAEAAFGPRPVTGAPFNPAQLAGMAAAALDRVNTPEFRRLLTGAFGAASQTFERRPAAAPSRQPEPPRGEVPPVAAFAPVEPTPPPSGTGDFRLPPGVEESIERVAAQAGHALENVAAIAARAIETAAGAVERWAEQQRGVPRTPDDHDDPRPH